MNFLCYPIWRSLDAFAGDHRLNHVQDWAARHLESIGVCIEQDIRGLDLSDDRLESVLRYLSEDRAWRNFERAMSQRQLLNFPLEIYNKHG
jgi:hypothetical protein